MRDRAEAYAEAARLGAPGACQVADRCHLLRNRADAVTPWVTAHTTQLAQLHAERTADPTPADDPACLAEASARPSVPLAPRPSSTAAARLARRFLLAAWPGTGQA